MQSDYTGARPKITKTPVRNPSPANSGPSAPIDALSMKMMLEKYTDSSASRAHYELAPRPAESDKAAGSRDTVSMSDMNREELQARLETIEVKMDARVESVSAKIDGFLSAQAERDKRYELMAERITKAAEGAEEAARQAATVKANYWAAVVVQLLAVVAILVGAYFANQANVLGVMQTTMSAIQAGKDGAVSQPQSTPAPSSPAIQPKR